MGRKILCKIHFTNRNFLRCIHQFSTQNLQRLYYIMRCIKNSIQTLEKRWTVLRFNTNFIMHYVILCIDEIEKLFC